MKRKLLTAILALFLPLLSAGQQSLSAFLFTSGPNSDPGTLVCSLDDVGGIGFVSAGANGVTVQRVDDISPFPSCHNVFTTTVLPARVPRIMQEELQEPIIEFAAPLVLIIDYFSPLGFISVFCQQ